MLFLVIIYLYSLILLIFQVFFDEFLWFWMQFLNVLAVDAKTIILTTHSCLKAVTIVLQTWWLTTIAWSLMSVQLFPLSFDILVDITKRGDIDQVRANLLDLIKLRESILEFRFRSNRTCASLHIINFSDLLVIIFVLTEDSHIGLLQTVSVLMFTRSLTLLYLDG